MDLKPCPFCGDENIKYIQNEISRHAMYCLDCGASTGYHKTISAAMEAWNTRVNGWHKWPDEKPEEDESYILYNSICLGYTMAHWYKGNWVHSYPDAVAPTHWMKLIDPPSD